MKKLFFLFALIIHALSLVSTAQTIRFTDPTNIWKVGKWTNPDGDPSFFPLEYKCHYTPYEHNGYLYTPIALTQSSEAIYAREDTLSRKIYIMAERFLYQNMKVTTSDEFVYMDFSMNVGDTLIMPVVWDWQDEDSVSIHTVYAIDSMLVGNNWHKRMTMEIWSGLLPQQLPSNYYFLVEGFGSYSGPVIEPEYNHNEWGPFNLYCFSNNGIVPNPPFYSNCMDPVSVSEQTKTINNFTLFPNPATHQFTIIVHSGFRNKVIEIADLSGRNLLTHVLSNTRSVIDVGSLQTGIFIVKLLEDGNITYVKKLVIR